MGQEKPELFDTNKYNKWDEHWQGMPEYDNDIIKPPLITALFKFRTQEDYDTFHAVIKKYLYNGEKVFDGMQRKNSKIAWYPLSKKASQYRYE